MIVDDNEDIFFILKMLLCFIVELISIMIDLRELFFILLCIYYDVILLDMNFRNDVVSGWEGFYWLEEILKLDLGVVVIFIMVYVDIEKVVWVIKFGVIDFIVKFW